MYYKAEPCYLVDKITGEIVARYGTMQQATDALGLHVSLNRSIRQRKLLDACRYVIRLVDDYDAHESFAGKKRAVPVMLEYADHAEIYNDSMAAAKATNYAHNTISDGLRTGRMIGGQFRAVRMPYMGAYNEMIKRGFAEVYD